MGGWVRSYRRIRRLVWSLWGAREQHDKKRNSSIATSVGGLGAIQSYTYIDTNLLHYTIEVTDKIIASAE